MKAWISWDEDYGFSLIPGDDRYAPGPGEGPLPVEVPPDLFVRLQDAEEAWLNTVKAIEDAVGYDRDNHRLTAACAAYDGEEASIAGRSFWDDCHTCGWKREEHSPGVGGPDQRPEQREGA